jgi:hypothetical protein
MSGKSRMPRQRHVIQRRQHRKTPRRVSTPAAAAEPKRELVWFVDRDGNVHLSDEVLRTRGIKLGTPVDLEILDKDKRIVGVRPRSPWGLSIYETVEEAAA